MSHNLHAFVAMLVPTEFLWFLWRTRGAAYEGKWFKRGMLAFAFALSLLFTVPVFFNGYSTDYPVRSSLLYLGCSLLAIFFVRSVRSAALLSAALVLTPVLLRLCLIVDPGLEGGHLSRFGPRVSRAMSVAAQAVPEQDRQRYLPACVASELPMSEEGREEFNAVSKDLRISEYTPLWHSWFTGIYAVERVPCKLMFRGGVMGERRWRAFEPVPLDPS